MKDKSSSKFTRREFIRTSVTTAGSAAIVAGLPAGALSQEEKGGKSTVIKVVSDKVLDEPQVTGQVQKQTVEKMLLAGLKKLTGKDSIASALGSFIDKKDVVGLKVNCLGKQYLSTHPEITDTLIEGLRELGLPANQIIVFDRYGKHLHPAGYTLSEEEDKVQCVGFDGDSDPEAAYTLPDGKTTIYFPKLVSQKITKIINLPVMKNHSIAGVTLSLKNLAFGLLHTERACHDDCCEPFISDACTQPMIRDRHTFSILDGILCGFEGGPGRCTDDKKEVNNAIYFSRDLVALDYVVREDLNGVRKKRKLPQVPSEQTKHIEAAAKRGLGVADPKRIALDLIEL